MSESAPFSLAGLGYVGVRAAEPVAWRDFATRVCGLEPALIPPGERQAGVPVPRPDARGLADDGSVFLKMDRRQWRFAIHPCAEAEQGLAYLGFELTRDDELAAAEYEERGGISQRTMLIVLGAGIAVGVGVTLAILAFT